MGLRIGLQYNAGSRGSQRASLPSPDILDIALVHDAVMERINEARVDHRHEPLVWDKVLQGLAEGRAWGCPREGASGAVLVVLFAGGGPELSAR